ncbi:TIGR00730 family Rossman fold protein [Reyranella aquatilis]|uniref:Cytokinin riboside 5'-monophosphate phosphoribohydrolase n=1 Tax=Reyranella aquatilis TaxID=2035356 RepID=A0ABS8KWW9_9HYPH|nr:TIGR00730 family Rossman fold protein [Reyranella aquatilis]MCC8430550.1 TIGR00730 family Rossman fold protein [Reyranella aquatilis]
METNNQPQRQSRSFLLAVEDQDFLLSDEMRSLRFGMEYAKAELALRKACICSTVVVFGSARARSPEEIELLVSAGKLTGKHGDAQAITRYAAFYETAREFGRIVSLHGGALNAPKGCGENVIATGGGPGIMEAANRGAAEAGAPSIGFNITLPGEQQPNAYSTPALTFRFRYFAMRKMHLAMRANALAVFPGGFGTLDELFEILTLLQTKKAPPLPVVLFGRDYWRKVVNFEALAEEGMVAPADLELFSLVDEPMEAWEALCRHGLTAHPASARRSSHICCDAHSHDAEAAGPGDD